MQPFLHPKWKLQVYVYIFIYTPEVQDYYNIIVPNFGWLKFPISTKKWWKPETYGFFKGLWTSRVHTFYIP